MHQSPLRCHRPEISDRTYLAAPETVAQVIPKGERGCKGAPSERCQTPAESDLRAVRAAEAIFGATVTLDRVGNNALPKLRGETSGIVGHITRITANSPLVDSTRPDFVDSRAIQGRMSTRPSYPPGTMTPLLFAPGRTDDRG